MRLSPASSFFALALAGGLGTFGCVGQLGSVAESESSAGASDCEGLDLCPCEAPLECNFGHCTAPAYTAVCEAGDPFDTICGNDELCFENLDEQTTCIPMAPCPTDCDCPVGEFGAVCNEGGVPTKERVCLVGMCDGPEHCPDDFNCIQPFQGYGMCSSGSFGEPCSDDAHCDSGSCLILAPGAGTCL
jgi:hypothetical protein